VSGAATSTEPAERPEDLSVASLPKRSGPPAWCRAAVRDAVHKAAHLLPEQAPLHAFVHHNTLHAFEDLPFERAVEAAAAQFGAEPYPSEASLQRYREAGSLTESDVAAVVDEEFAPALWDAELGGVSWREFLISRLTTPLELPDAGAVRYLRSEELVTNDFHASVPEGRRRELEALAVGRYGSSRKRAVQELLGELWGAFAAVTPPTKVPSRRPIRRRDLLVELGGEDTDSLVIPHLIRLAAGYLDQGVSSWPMPEREQGFYHCFRELYRSRLGVLEKWLLSLDTELRRQASAEFTAEDACVWALDQLEVPLEGYADYIEAVLLALPGWAGMFRTVELHPEKCPVEAAPARLLDFLAVALVLEAHAASFVLASLGRVQEGGGPLRGYAQLTATLRAAPVRERDLALTYESFVLAQVFALDLKALLDRGLADAWLCWVERLSAVQRRRLLWKALERHHLVELTSSLSAHGRFLAQRQLPQPKFHAIFCIDDREESYRRHLEEVEPGASTFSYPGFFGVAMRFHAHDQLRPRDLCPVVVPATHIVRELAARGASSARAVGLGVMPHRHLGSTTLVRGFLLSLLGAFSIVPLILQVLFPRWFHSRRQRSPSQVVELAVARTREPEAGQLPEGYTDAEMAAIVARLLADIGLTSDFSPLVLVIGHGASSVNNPLLAAYGCGATAGGCGGPNARVLAEMANRVAVRELLRRRGIDIPAGTTFVGGMHDTTSDDVILYAKSDLDPAAERSLAVARRGLREASVANAHERCRLFHRVPTTIEPLAAKAVVESRSADLAAARPEFNHAKNSCAIVGRRLLTRGLFLDKRAFLVSSDPTSDPDGEALERMILGSLPVGMGINLEYFFATIDNAKYGSGSKLPHNVSGLMGIMNGHASDLRTGLNAQMVEPHEPVRLVSVIEADPDLVLRILERRPALRELSDHGWMQLVAWVPDRDEFYHFTGGHFRRLDLPPLELPVVGRSIDAYRGRRGTLPFAHVTAGLELRP